MGGIVMLAVWFVCVLSAGWGVLSVAVRRGAELWAPEQAALSYGLGLGAISVWMAILSASGIRIGIANIAAFSLVMLLPAIFLKKFAVRKKGLRVALSLTEKFFIGAISFEIAYAFFRALIMPIESYDAIAIYGIKSKIFYLAGGIPGDFFSSFGGFVPHVEYPLLIPLSETSVYVLLGGLNDVLSKVIFPAYYCATLAILYSAVRKLSNRKSALLFTFILATVPQFKEYATNGYADLPFAFYCSSSVIYIIAWIKERRLSYLVLSMFLSACAIWTKPEGMMLAAVNSSIVFYHGFLCDKKAMRQAAGYLLVYLLFASAYLYLLGRTGLRLNSDFSAARPGFLPSLKRIPAILYEYQRQFFGPKKWNIVWIVSIAAFFCCFKASFSRNIRYVTVAIMLIIGGYSAAYMLTPQALSWHLSTTASRLFLHFLPLAVLWLALIYKEKGLEL